MVSRTSDLVLVENSFAPMTSFRGLYEITNIVHIGRQIVLD